MADQYLDKNGVATLWGKTKGLVSGKANHQTHTNVNVIGSTHSTESVGDYQLVFPKGAVFAGTAQAAGLVTRGICGVTTPDSTGACSKERLYINYDGNNTYNPSRGIVINAGTTGSNLGQNLYEYLAVRGDVLKNYCDAHYSATSHTHTFASLTSKPTTLAGYGITDAPRLTKSGSALDIAISNDTDLNTTFALSMSDGKEGTSARITVSDDNDYNLDDFATKATTLAGYGITDACTKAEGAKNASDIASIKSQIQSNAGFFDGLKESTAWQKASNSQELGKYLGDSVSGNVDLLDTMLAGFGADSGGDLQTIGNTCAGIRENADKVSYKQDNLVSGTNIKTVNGQSLLGSGDLTFSSSHAISADYLTGFDGRYGIGWGELSKSGYTAVTDMGTNGADVSFAYKDGRMYFQLDGDVYVQEGLKKLATEEYVDNKAGAKLSTSGGTLTGGLNANDYVQFTGNTGLRFASTTDITNIMAGSVTITVGPSVGNEGDAYVTWGGHDNFGHGGGTWHIALGIVSNTAFVDNLVVGASPPDSSGSGMRIFLRRAVAANTTYTYTVHWVAVKVW